MKKLFFLGTFFFCFLGQAQEPLGTELTVNISNVPGNQGKVIIGLFNKDTFMKAAPLQSGNSEITEGKATFTFNDNPAGEYGIISFHDKNDNGTLDMELSGMPTEAYGVSNNPISYGPPQWSDARFEVRDSPVKLEIRY